MNSLVERFLLEIIDEHSNINRGCDDYDIIITEENLPFIIDMILTDDNKEHMSEDIEKLNKLNIGDKFHMYGFDRNRYVRDKIFPKVQSKMNEKQIKDLTKCITKGVKLYDYVFKRVNKDEVLPFLNKYGIDNPETLDKHSYEEWCTLIDKILLFRKVANGNN